MVRIVPTPTRPAAELAQLATLATSLAELAARLRVAAAQHPHDRHLEQARRLAGDSQRLAAALLHPARPARSATTPH